MMSDKQSWMITKTGVKCKLWLRLCGKLNKLCYDRLFLFKFFINEHFKLKARPSNLKKTKFKI